MVMRNIGKILAASGAAAAMWAVPLSNPAHAGLITVGAQETGVNAGDISVLTTSNTGGIAWAVITYGAFNSSGSASDTQADGLPEILTSNSIDTALNVSGTHTITIYVTSQGLTVPTGISSWASSFTANVLPAGWSVTMMTYFDQSNNLYNGADTSVASTAVLLQSATLTAIGTSGPSDNVEDVTPPFSITEVYTITGFWNGSVSQSHLANDTIDLSAVDVPEPPTVLMLGMGLLGLGFLARRLNKRA
jgi:hypothetical protein